MHACPQKPNPSRETVPLTRPPCAVCSAWRYGEADAGHLGGGTSGDALHLLARPAPLETLQLSNYKKWDILQKIYVRPHALKLLEDMLVFCTESLEQPLPFQYLLETVTGAAHPNWRRRARRSEGFGGQSGQPVDCPRPFVYRRCRCVHLRGKWCLQHDLYRTQVWWKRVSGLRRPAALRQPPRIPLHPHWPGSPAVSLSSTVTFVEPCSWGN